MTSSGSPFAVNVMLKASIGTEKSVTVAKNQGKIMFMSTENFKFLDILNYLDPRTKYEKWVKTYKLPRQNRGCHTNGLPMLTNWIIRVCRRIGNGFQN